MWGGSGAVYKARGAEDPMSRLLPPWAVTSVTWSGLLCSPPIKSSVSSPGSSPLRTGTRVCHPGCAPPDCHPSFRPGPREMPPCCSFMVCFVLWLCTHGQPAWLPSGHMSLVKTGGHPWSWTAPCCPGGASLSRTAGAQEGRLTLFTVPSVPQRSANPSQLDHCPGGSPRLEDPHGPVFGAQSRN